MRKGPSYHDEANFNWRLYAKRIEADPEAARRGFVRFLLAVMVLACLLGSIVTSLVWALVT